MDEANELKKSVLALASEAAMAMDTMGGRVHVRWDETAHATLMLGILAGSKRYAHIAGVRGDAVAAKALGLRGMVSEDSVRRALAAMTPESSEPWMRDALMLE